MKDSFNLGTLYELLVDMSQNNRTAQS